MIRRYNGRYQNSWALVIGINTYRHVNPLKQARSDAEGVAAALSTLGFPQTNTKLLLDDAATASEIRKHYLSFIENSEPDDRVVVFFAGHGTTRQGSRGDVGFLIPVDGDPDALDTFIRWDELTRSADLIPAKHVLFLMDACYGGLALVRTVKPGTMRFAGDMLTRFSRQVLTSGKMDEVVSDAGGRRPNHSVFTSYLLDALQGDAAGADGILTAANVTAYVYQRVARDDGSNQSPHFGHLDGDGDLIFNPPEPRDVPGSETPGDVLLQMPVVPEEGTRELDFTRTVKELLSDPGRRIELDDVVTTELKGYLLRTDNDSLPSDGVPITPDSVRQRLDEYDRRTEHLLTLAVLLTKWGEISHLNMLQRIFARMTDNNEVRGGTTGWLRLRWYPICRLLYATAITAHVTEQMKNQRAIAEVRVAPNVGERSATVLWEALTGMHEGVDMFKELPEFSRSYVPMSEYLFKNLQQPIEDLLFLGRSYEQSFDGAEVLLSLLYRDLDNFPGWCPPGRFVWKHRRGYGESPLQKILDVATAESKSWPPLQAGLFGGNLERLDAHAKALLESAHRNG